MEVVALNSFQSVSRDLANLSDLDTEIRRLQRLKRERLKYAARKKPGVDPALISADSALDLRTLVRTPKEEQIAPEEPEPVLPFGVKSPFQKGSLNQTILFFLYRVLRRFGKGFLLGWVVKSFFKVLPGVIKSGGNPGKIVKALEGALKWDQIGFGAFLGTFLALFQSIMRAARADLGVFGKWRASLAGVVAGSAMFLMPKSFRLGLSMFFCVRALELLATNLASQGYLPRVKHGDTILMAVASSQVLYATMFARESLDPVYLRFLDIHAGKPKTVLSAFAAYARGGMPSSSDVDWLNRVRANLTPPVGPLNLNSLTLTCDITHPHTASCTKSFVLFWFEELQRAVRVYIPVYSLPIVLFKLKLLFKQPLSTLKGALAGVARSSAFLATYCASAWLAVCTLRNLGFRSPIITYVAGLVAGTSVVMEKEHRRIELALYVFSHALQSAYRCLLGMGLAPSIPNGECYLFMAAMAVFMHSFIEKPQLLRSGYLRLAAYFFGSGSATWQQIGSERESPRPSPKLAPSLDRSLSSGASRGLVGGLGGQSGRLGSSGSLSASARQALGGGGGGSGMRPVSDPASAPASSASAAAASRVVETEENSDAEVEQQRREREKEGQGQGKDKGQGQGKRLTSVEDEDEDEDVDDDAPAEDDGDEDAAAGAGDAGSGSAAGSAVPDAETAGEDTRVGVDAERSGLVRTRVPQSELIRRAKESGTPPAKVKLPRTPHTRVFAGPPSGPGSAAAAAAPGGPLLPGAASAGGAAASDDAKTSASAASQGKRR